jgi:pimeloyl-ACP methyl ester carboxylesterase
MSSAARADHWVVLLHGLGRTRRSLARMDRALTERGFSTLRVGYPSRSQSIDAHADYVATRLGRAPATAKLSFVTHSLGGLIVRKLCSYEAPWRKRMSRIVMLAPPNHGASLASTLDQGGVIRRILGPSYVQIAEGFAETLPVPDVPFAIFAGDVPGVPGDGLLTVDETRLEGAAEHHLVPVIHTFIMNHPAVIEGTTAFLSAAPD